MDLMYLGGGTRSLLGRAFSEGGRAERRVKMDEKTIVTQAVSSRRCERKWSRQTGCWGQKKIFYSRVGGRRSNAKWRGAYGREVGRLYERSR